MGSSIATRKDYLAILRFREISFRNIFFILLINLCFSFNVYAEEWQTLCIHGSIHLRLASSELDDPGPYKFGRYGTQNLFDYDSSTCWAEGVPGNGIGESLYVGFEENIQSIFIVNGYAKTKNIFYRNNRVKKIKISILVGINKPGYVSDLYVLYDATKFKHDTIIQLEDTMAPQEIEFPFDCEELKQFKESSLQSFVKSHAKELEDYTKKLEDLGIKEGELNVQYIMLLEIVDVYKGSKYEDTCISDIWFLYAGDKGGESGVGKDYGKITDIYVGSKENIIYIDTIKKKKIILDSVPDAVFQIIEKSDDNDWVIVITMPADVGTNRVETEYILYNTEYKEKVDKRLIGEDVGSLLGFIKENKTTYLLFMDNNTMEEEKVDLDALYMKLQR